MTRKLYKTYEEVIDRISEMIEMGVPLHYINIEKKRFSDAWELEFDYFSDEFLKQYLS